MHVIINSVSIENKGKYKVAKVEFTSNGAAKKQQVVSFGDSAEVFSKLVEAKAGDAYEVTVKKDGNFWNWVGIAPASVSGGATTPTGGNTIPPRGNYETPEERLRRQVYIVKQSSISSAIDFLKHNKKNFDLEEILLVATRFEEFVFSKKQQTAFEGIQAMEDDVPL